MQTIIYTRDGRAPIPKNNITSMIMSRIRAKDTGPERVLRKALQKASIIGAKYHYKKLPGRPDISYTKKKLAIFVNGCYWHRCPKCKPSMPKSHIKFWQEKFQKNVHRDKLKITALKKMGWKVIVIWECEIKKDIIAVTNKIKRHYYN